MSPPLIKKTWSTAEDTVNLAARYALPVVQTFEKPIHAVDSLACKTLDKVEETIPMVNKTPDEVLLSLFLAPVCLLKVWFNLSDQDLCQ